MPDLAATLFLSAALFSMFFFLTLFVQDVLHYSPLRAGFAFVPVSAAIVVAAQISSRQLLRVGPKPFMVLGSVLATAGLAWLSQLSTESSYLGGILGPMLIFSVGMGFLFVPLTVVAVSGVADADSGAASGMLNVTQQVGGSLGLSVLVTVFGTASRNESHHQVPAFLSSATAQMRQAFGAGNLPLPEAFQNRILAHGISAAFEVGVIFAAVALLVSVMAISKKASDVDASAVPGAGA